MSESLRQPSPYKDVPTVASGGIDSPFVEDKTTEQELREKIAKMMFSVRTDMVRWGELTWDELYPEGKEYWLILATQILTCIKEAGWIDPSTVLRVEGDDKRGEQLLAQWLKANGYVKLAENQEPPDQPNIMVFCNGDYAYDQGQKSMLKEDWRKVMLEAKDIKEVLEK